MPLFLLCRSALVSYCVALLLSTENGITIASRRGVEYFRLQKTSGSTRQIKTKMNTCTQTPPRNTLRNNYLPCSFLTFDLPFLLPYLNGRCEKPAAYNQVEQIYTQVHSYLEAACNDACCVAVPKGEASGSEAAIKAVLSLWKEVEYYREYQQRLRLYLGEEKAAEIIKEALYLISIGTNDFMENYFSRPGGRALEFSVEQYQSYLIAIAEDFIIDLYNLGARKLSLGGLPPMGCLPLERTTNVMHKRLCVEAYNNVAKEFNWKLENLVDKLNHELMGLHLVFSNPYDLLMEMIRQPSSFGFDYADIACCATGFVEMGYMCDRLNPFTCADAEKYVFWDAFHPTNRTNALIATHLVNNYLTKFL